MTMATSLVGPVMAVQTAVRARTPRADWCSMARRAASTSAPVWPRSTMPRIIRRYMGAV